MEYDRYQQNHSLFIIAMSCLVLSMGLFGFSIYIAPALIWEIHYNIPPFVINWREILHLEYEYTEKASAWLVFLTFFIPACIAGYIAYLTSNQLENQVYHIEPETPDPTVVEERSEDLRESTGLGLKIFLLIVMVIIVTVIFQWFFSVTT
jgi:hypothetical protein